MEPKLSPIVKAIYDFTTDVDDELPLQVNDLIQVIERVDKHWGKGCLNGQTGNFPLGFTVEVKAPDIKDSQQLFAATNDFVAQEAGDLTFKRGDLIVGNQAIDENWWQGEAEGQHGIFPLTFVWKLDKNLFPKPSAPKKLSLKAVAKANIKAQLKDELDLMEGEVINITEEVDKGWYRGECNGRSGIFSASFVSIIPSDQIKTLKSMDSTDEFQNETDLFQNADQYGYDCIGCGITAYGHTLYPFTAKYDNELTFDKGEIVKLIRHVDENWTEGEIDGRVGIFPTSFISIVVDCPSDDKKKQDSSFETSECLLIGSKAQVSFDFHPQLEGDVRLRKGDVVTLVKKIDDDWYEVLTECGQNCVCPESYIEAIETGPPPYAEVMKSFDMYKNTNDLDFKPDRPLSYPPSLDSSASSNKYASSRNSSMSIDNKIAESLKALDTSFSSSNKSFSSDGNQSPLPSYFIEDRNLQGATALPSHAESTYQNLVDIQEDNTSDSWSPNFLNAEMNHVQNNRNSGIEISDDADVSSIKKRLDIKEQQLKQRTACRNKLRGERRPNETFTSSEISTQISDLDIEISRLEKDIKDLKTELASLGIAVSGQSVDEQRLKEEAARKKEMDEEKKKQERVKKMKEQRECVLLELVQTERDYISDLKTLQRTFLQNTSEAKSKGIDVTNLFGNLDEVIEVASDLLKRFQVKTNGVQMIGQCFVDKCDELKEVYGHYCRNHDEVNSLLDKYEENHAANEYLKHKVEMMKRQTNCFDLPSMLIKPVQRILKYPLLLNELFKCTEDEHPDKQSLIEAIGLMTDVATAINEFKRRKDLVFKYRKQADTSLSGRFSKLSLHSMLKKSSRMSMRLYSSIGLKSVTRDHEFESIEKKFVALEKSIRLFLKDIGIYTEKAEELASTAFSMSEDIADLYQERKSQEEVDQFRAAHHLILTQFWEAFKQTIDRSAHSPLKVLLHSFRGPSHLIQKRYDKLLDYELCTSKVEKNKDATKMRALQDNQVLAKNNYDALNSQLLDELPKLYSLSIEIFYDCIRCFLKAKKSFIGKTANHMMGLMELPLLLGSRIGDTLDTFHVKHTLITDSLCQLSVVPKQLRSCVKGEGMRRNSSPRSSKLSYGAASPALQSRKSSQQGIESCYPPSDLYVASVNYNAVDVMDVSLKKGDVVAVIKRQDPMGNNLRWFIDNGERKGFVPEKCLTKHAAANTTQQVNSTNSIHNGYRNSLTVNTSNQKTTIKSVHNQNMPHNKVIRPARPAPPVTNSLRTVAPSRYPPPKQPVTPQPKTLMDSNRNTEPQHRYEEITDLLGSIQRYDDVSDDTNSTGNLMDMNSQPNTAQCSNNLLEEFDPYANPKVDTELYDNVPDNLNCLYNSHRYEDIPDGDYDVVPNDTEQQETAKYYFAAYDFSPTGPNQLLLTKGQVVLVLYSDTEWWFVKDRHGNTGYVPALYLAECPKAAAQH